MSELELRPLEEVSENELLNRFSEPPEFTEENLTLAFETINVICRGLTSTPLRAYSDSHVQDALRCRVNELSQLTNYSAESIHSSIDNLMQVNPSFEGAFFDAVKAVIARIMDWVKSMWDFLATFVKNMFVFKNTVQQTTQKAATTFKEAKKEYKAAKETFPDFVTLELPGRCYTIFHSATHQPKPGYVYNTTNLYKAIEGIHKDMKFFIQKVRDDMDMTLNIINSLIQNIDNLESNTARDALWSFKRVRGIRELHNRNMQFIGFKMASRPVRNETVFVKERYTLRPVADEYGWNSSGSFKMNFTISEYERINKTVQVSTGEIIMDLVKLTSDLKDSRVVKRFYELRNSTKLEITLHENMPGEGSRNTHINFQKILMERLEFIFEQLGQLSDNVMLIDRFYISYSTMLSKLLLGISQQLKDRVSN